MAAYIISKENSAVDDMITSWFREAHYRSITLGGKGGTTATIICLLNIDGNKFIISANVGDSKAVLKDITSGASPERQISCDHSAENPEEFLAYHEHCDN